MLSLRCVVVDTTDPGALAAFWSAVLRVPLRHDWGEYVILASDPQMSFQYVGRPTEGKNRLHIDLQVDGETDVEAEIERLLDLGATRVASVNMRGVAWVVLADPDGNEFCVFTEVSPEILEPRTS